MKLIIDISDDAYEQIKNHTEGYTAEGDAVYAVRNGKPYKEVQSDIVSLDDGTQSEQALNVLKISASMLEDGLKYFPDNLKASFKKAYEFALKVLEKPRGEWIEQTEYNGDTYYDCSICGNSWTTIEGTPWQNGMSYCPNCGALMNKEVKNG